LAGAFRQGAADLLPAALVVALAKGLVLLLGGDNPAKPSVLNTLLFHMGDGLSGLPTAVAAWLMLALQSVTNFFVPSGSGQAALVMPLMAPLSDLLGVVKLDWGTWFRVMWRFQLWLFGIASAFVVAGVVIGYH
jgi:uncharacterized ion transporter superfamily protein YfcC